MFNVLSALPGFSQEILCIAKLMTANCSAECPTQHMRRSCGAEGVQSAWFVVKTMTVDVFDTLTLSFLLDENILGK